MRCPYCGQSDSRVVDSRSTDEGEAIRRRRECTACGRRFTTYERWEEVPLMVVKKDGTREPFNRAKILGGLLKACEKRSVPMDRMEAVALDIEKELRNRMEVEASSREIGEMVIDRLRELDEVAYVRFASVYREFRDLGRLMEEVEKLLRKES